MSGIVVCMTQWIIYERSIEIADLYRIPVPVTKYGVHCCAY
jgi:hypothetical protein